MIKKVFYRISERQTRYLLMPEGVTKNFELENLYFALDPMEDVYVHVDMIPQTNTVFFWSSDSFKQRARMKFKTLQEEEAFESAYQSYYDKRWEDMPKLEISNENYNELITKWKKIKQEKPEYVIFTLEKSKPLDKVNIISKNKLSPQDLQDMRYEYEQYLKWKEACFKYATNHHDYSEVWRSPADDEYEADIAKYYEE